MHQEGNWLIPGLLNRQTLGKHQPDHEEEHWYCIALQSDQKNGNSWDTNIGHQKSPPHCPHFQA